MSSSFTRREFLALAGAVAAVPLDAADVRLSEHPTYRLDPYRGLGAWIDVFDWSVGLAPGGTPAIGTAQVTALAASGVRTVYLQCSRSSRPERADDLLERPRLLQLVDAAHAAGMRVVAWYLPGHVDHELDLRRGYAVLGEPAFDGLALDIESRVEPDVALRNRRLADLVVRLRTAAGRGTALGAIVVPPTTMEDVNPDFWPGFDWAMLAATCDVFLPMNYWTGRLASSPWRNAGASCVENIRRLRAHAGRADYPVHMIGGIADTVTVAEVAALVAAVRQEGALGGSLYDVVTSSPALWSPLAGLAGL